MKIVNDYMSLSHTQLREALFTTVTSGSETAQMKKELKDFYSVLSLEELRAKASKLSVLYMPDDILPAQKTQRWSKERHIAAKKVPIIPTIQVKSEVTDWEAQTTLLSYSFVKDVVVIAPGALGVNIAGVQVVGELKTNRALRRMGYKGTVIYG
jgi:hypothetical protein